MRALIAFVIVWSALTHARVESEAHKLGSLGGGGLQRPEVDTSPRRYRFDEKNPARADLELTLEIDNLARRNRRACLDYVTELRRSRLAPAAEKARRYAGVVPRPDDDFSWLVPIREGGNYALLFGGGSYDSLGENYEPIQRARSFLKAMEPYGYDPRRLFEGTYPLGKGESYRSAPVLAMLDMIREAKACEWERQQDGVGAENAATHREMDGIGAAIGRLEKTIADATRSLPELRAAAERKRADLRAEIAKVPRGSYVPLPKWRDFLEQSKDHPELQARFAATEAMIVSLGPPKDEEQGTLLYRTRLYYFHQKEFLKTGPSYAQVKLMMDETVRSAAALILIRDKPVHAAEARVREAEELIEKADDEIFHAREEIKRKKQYLTYLEGTIGERSKQHANLNGVSLSVFYPLTEMTYIPEGASQILCQPPGKAVCRTSSRNLTNY